MSILVALWLSLAPALAGDDVSEAEHRRLSEDLKQLTSRQIWVGADRKFQELEKLGVEPTYEDLMNGAYAARSLGNMASVYDRLKRAAKLKGTREVVDWLYTIDANYGPVELTASPPRGVTLEPTETPFDPDQRLAVEKAVELVKKDGNFAGLLPRGDYAYAGQHFHVEPGIAVKLELAPRMKKTQGELITTTTTPAEGGGAP